MISVFILHILRDNVLFDLVWPKLTPFDLYLASTWPLTHTNEICTGILLLTLMLMWFLILHPLSLSDHPDWPFDPIWPIYLQALDPSQLRAIEIVLPLLLSNITDVSLFSSFCTIFKIEWTFDPNWPDLTLIWPITCRIVNFWPLFIKKCARYNIS